ncbi:MAG: 5-formyltetrahydrofolate cyclo-ligase [Cyclobacteriaceae bacterium]
MDTKKTLRSLILTNRRLLSDDFLKDANKKLIKNVLEFMQVYDTMKVHCFLPISKNNEPDTWLLIHELLKREYDIMTSVTEFKSRIMKHYWIEKNTFYVQGTFDIPEPKNCEAADIMEAEMIFIPLVASDKKGNRIGYGKGFYDELLASTDQDVLKVGLSLTSCFDLFPFKEAHDVNLDFCITPTQIIQCHDD